MTMTFETAVFDMSGDVWPAIARLSHAERVRDLVVLSEVIGTISGQDAFAQQLAEAAKDLEEPSTSSLAVTTSPLFRLWLHRTGRRVLDVPTGSPVSDSVDPQPPIQAAARWRVDHDARARCLTTGVVVRNDMSALRPPLKTDTVPQRHGTFDGGRSDADRFPAGMEPAYLEALSILSLCDTFVAKARCLLRVVVPWAAPQGWTVGGFTYAAAQGACWITKDDPIKMAETIAHELAHVELRYLEEAFGRVAEGVCTEKKYFVPWRSDLRPVEGIVEGVYVHAVAAQQLARLSEVLTGETAAAYRERASALAEESSICLGIVEEALPRSQRTEAFLGAVRARNASVH